MNHRLEDEDTQSDLLQNDKQQTNNINATKQEGRDYSSIIDKEKLAKRKKIKWGIIGLLILIAVILAIVLPLTLKKSGGGGGGNNNKPFTFEHYNPYKLKESKDLQSNASGTISAPTTYSHNLHMQALERVIPVTADGKKKLGIDSKAIPTGANNKFSANLNYQFDLVTWRVAHLLITDADSTRYSIPEMAVPKPKGDNTMRLDMLGVEFATDPFSFTFKDPVNPDRVLLTTKDQSLVFMDKFIQMDFKLPSQRLYGLGERVHDFQLTEGTWTMWAIGLDSPVDDGTGRKGTYGVHPFVLVQTEKKGDYIGMFFRNSNAQSPVVKYNSDGTSTLSYITTGGQIEVYFFVHGTAKQIISQYQQLFGKPNLPPFWSLGWQQASWKYLDQNMVEEVIDKYAEANMPLETMYLDIPYMDKYKDFTVDKKAFGRIADLAKRLHNADQRLVLILDAAVSADDTNDVIYQQGNTLDVFIKSALYTSDKYNNNLIAKVWPDKAVFIDWFNEKSLDFWRFGLEKLRGQVDFDGIWIDMNEPTTFSHGEIKPEDAKVIEPKKPVLRESDQDETADWYYEFKDQSDMSTFKLPFVPGYVEHADGKPGPFDGNFDYMTLSLNSTIPSIKEVTYNVHSLYGLMMSNRTYAHVTSDQAKRPDERPFILTRSSFASSGRFVSHWLGDNWRKWEYMRYSIAGMMNMNMFGIPHVGADVCGFFGEKKDDQMCARWIQLATFYPLARTHQNLTYNDAPSERSEPYLLEGKYKQWALFSIRDRYHYLRHMYTCLFEVSQNGGSCIDPLFYYYPDDDNVYDDTTSTFMVGGAIKVSPVLEQLADDVKTFKSYFPKGSWVSLVNLNRIVKSKGEMIDLPTDQSTVHAHLRPGSLIAYQNTVIAKTGNQVMTTKELLTQPTQIIINRDENGNAQGSLFLDQGIHMSEIQSKSFEYYQIQHQAKSIQFQLQDGTRGKQQAQLDKIIIANADDLKNVNFACYMDNEKQFHPFTLSYDETMFTLTFSPKNGETTKFSDILNVYYGSTSNNDLNLCSPTTWNYKIKDGVLPDLKKASATVNLTHVAGVLPDIQVKLRVIELGIVNVKWSWLETPEGYRTPAEVPNDIIDTNKADGPTNLLSTVSIQDNPFQVTFKYKSDSMKSNVLTIKGMIFDQYLNWIEVQAQTQSTGDAFQGIMGLGERANKDFFLKDGVYSMWSRDIPTPDETGKLPGNNMYGTHPFFMYKHKPGAWVGVLYKLAHAQDWWVKNNKNTGTIDLSTIATGGVADIYVIQGQQPDSVINLYFTLIGRPVMVPQWALGWNQCRWGYDTLDKLKAVVKGYDDNKIPLDVAWSDIDWMNKYRNFEYDQVNFKGLPEYIDELHASNRKYVPIVDAGVAYRPKQDYTAFNDAYDQKLFTTINGEPFIGQVWPNDAAFPDFFKPETVKWFQSNLDKIHQQVPFDGLWEDMNEASNFCQGACYREQVVDHPVKYNLKYTPTGRDLELKSMSLDTTHSNGLLQLDTHNYYGTQEVKATHEWFQAKNKRTFIIERSSFAGMGKYASRWLGDNFSEERFMGYSVSGIMQMNIFGITFAGSDICGFIGDTNPELCARWHFVGAYYPFSRNHNNWGQKPQEPWAWEDAEYETGKKYIDLFREAIKLKYSLLRYYYTNLFMVSYYTQGTFFKPMFFEFPEDPNAYINITQNVMVGEALKVSFNSEYQKQNITKFYFPQGIWCDIVRKTVCIESTGQTFEFSTKVYETYMHLRNGFILPYQDTSAMDFKTSKDLQDQPIDLHILGEPAEGAQGFLRWDARGVYVNDDGETLDITKNFNGYNFRASVNGDITLLVIPSYQADNYKDKLGKGCTAVNKNDFLSSVYFYNAKNFQNNVAYNVKVTYYGQIGSQDVGQATYNTATDRLEFKLKDPLCLNTIQQLVFSKAA